ncbi:MAG: tellurite resistance TerB family protein [Alphaproteobacteria bacterium]|nr:tellurite resistance TerB family protein [Alphaproteobacteria bacterium]
MLEALHQGMGRHQRRAFWEATIAVCALVAAPDGKVSFATRVRIDYILDSLPDLKIFDTNEFVETFDRFVEEFRVGPTKARTRALEVARKGASDPDEAELLVRIAAAVAGTEVEAGQVDLEPVEALCRELGVDPKSISSATSAPDEDPKEIDSGETGSVIDEPAAPVIEPPSELKTVDVTVEEEADMTEDQTPGQESEVITMRPASAESAPAPEAPAAVTPATAAPAAAQNSDLSQQLAVDGTRAVIALCGRTKTGALEALRIYENEQIAAADCALSEKIANEKFWVSPVTLFPSGANGSVSAGNGEPTPIHVLCLSRPDGSIEALRAFESADNASADLDFFRNISNDKMWVSVVQFKTVI